MSHEPTALDRFMSNRAGVMLLVGIVGMGLLGWVGFEALAAPWHLDDGSPTVMSSVAKCNPRTGAHYSIRVGGQSYDGCAGATNRCAEVEAIAIAYDPRDPSQCRVASAVDRFGRYEATVMLLALGLSFAGVAAAAFVLSQRAMKQATHARLQRASWAALAAAAVTANGAALYALL